MCEREDDNRFSEVWLIKIESLKVICLKIQRNISLVFQDIEEEKEFFHITIACED